MEDKSIRILSGMIFLVGIAALVFFSRNQEFPERKIGDLGVDGEAVLLKGTVQGARRIGNLTFIVIRQERDIEIMIEDDADISLFRKGQKVAVKGKVSEGGESIEPFTLELG